LDILIGQFAVGPGDVAGGLPLVAEAGDDQATRGWVSTYWRSTAAKSSVVSPKRAFSFSAH